MLKSRHIIRGSIIGLASVALLQACSRNNNETPSTTSTVAELIQPLAQVERTADGVVRTLPEGPAKKVRLQVMADNIILVTAIPGDSFSVIPPSIPVAAQPTTTLIFTTDPPDIQLVLNHHAMSAAEYLADG